MNCEKCEMLQENVPIKVIDIETKSPFMEDIFHFEEGYRCMYNGEENLDIKKLNKKACRFN